MGQIPNFYYTSRSRLSQPIYITFGELWNWAVHKTNTTQEGEPYHDAADLLLDAFDAIAEFFDGSLGTFVNPLTGQTINYPEICESEDIQWHFRDNFNSRLIYRPLFNNFYTYTDDNDEYWYNCVKTFSKRIERFCKFNFTKYNKLIQLSAIDYNPLADFWTKEKELNATAPYATIKNHSGSEYGDMNSWEAATGKTDYKITTGPENNTTGITTTHQTTTFDSTSFRDESKDISLGKTEQKNEIPQSATLRKKEIEGNDASPMQDIIEKEFNIAHLWDIVDTFMNEIAKEVFLQVYPN